LRAAKFGKALPLLVGSKAKACFHKEIRRSNKLFCTFALRKKWGSGQISIQNDKAMKENLHPSNYRVCAFKDMGTGDVTLIRSCANAKDTFEVDGVAYPLVKMEVSSYSHPFYTGKQKLLDTAGRVDKFRNRYAKFTK
jgi:large subunit ribosomal protein L31